MQTTIPFLSLVTYTYNDQTFVSDLLRQAGKWNVPVGEAVVVDDASGTPFSFDEDVGFPVNVVRLERNVGPGMVKAHGVKAARGEVLLSLDADIRPHARWLGHAVPLLGQTDIGVVGATCLPRAGNSYLAKALYRTSCPAKRDYDSDFLQGGCLLFRRAVWDALEGIEHYKEEGWAYEDIYLSAKVKGAGLRLVRADTYPVYELRELHRTAYCRRGVAYLGGALSHIVERYGVERYLTDMRTKFETAVAYLGKSGDPILVYVTFMNIVQALAEAGARPGTPFSAEDVLAGTAHALSGYPNTLALFAEDLEKLGYALQPAVPFPPFAVLAAYLEPALQALESEWTARYRKEDADINFAAHYLEERAASRGKR